MVVSHLTSLSPSFFNCKNVLCDYFKKKKKRARIHHEAPVLAWACDSSSVNLCSCLHPSSVTSGLQASTAQHQGPARRVCPIPLSMLYPPQSADLSQDPFPVPQLSQVSPIHLVPNFPAWTRMCIPKATPADCFHLTSFHPCQIQF